jgi:catalytic LigB subunit of aromatic ring-opening dioxygenase
LQWRPDRRKDLIVAEITAALAASHAPGLTGWFSKADEQDQRTVEAAYAVIRQELVDSRADVLLVIGNDHVANARLNDYPDFTVGLADRHVGPDAWFKPWLRVPDYDLPGAPSVAAQLLAALEGSGRRLRGVSENLRFDDNLSVPATMTGLADLDMAVVPMLQNCTVPPVPDTQACYAFGQALGAAIREVLPADMRVALLGSGGLSHEPGGPRYLEIDEKFDRWWLDLLVDGDHQRVLEEATFERMEEAGSGGTSELLSWVVVMGAIGPRPCESLGYVAFDQWRCGVGAVRWDVTGARVGRD